MQAVADSSFLISLARAGLLTLVARLPFDLVWLDVVKQETVDAGIAGGHVDATAIEAATRGLGVRSTRPSRSQSVDAAVVEAAASVGLLLTNDLALGRRARNLGARWLRTADVVLLLHHLDKISKEEARAAIIGLREARRLSSELAEAYLQGIGERR